MSSAMQNPRRFSFFFFGCALKPEAVKGDFFIQVDKRSLSTKIFMIIEVLSRNLGQSINKN